jgi:hypothetical protein
MSACGYISDSGTQTPWSKRSLESMRAGRLRPSTVRRPRLPVVDRPVPGTALQTRL